ncbi:hypothetical protein BDZ91DRAFT_750268 [Kalaharituber pfeilii]|nr:hypothetical protein BDZ91DRAFT_750268 [Kalaharituber pfeilii]
MSDRQLVRVIYKDSGAYTDHHTAVQDIIEKDTGRPVIQTRSLPPIPLPVELTQEAIEKLKAYSGVKVEDIKRI